MPRTCIICGKRAGSREHIFPASLGGRRTDKGIYCGPHNKGFSPLARTISGQLKSINALLAVRPDHDDRAEPFRYTSPEGEELIIFNGTIRSAVPDPTRDQRHHVRLGLGGPELLRAVSYIALTFFAHHFREQARHAGMDAIKSFVQGHGDNAFAWWERPDKARLPANPFTFGHTIVVMTSAASQEATVFVSLFQSFHFGVRLGELEGLADKSVVVFIDPHADHPPDDIEVHRFDTVQVPLVRPEPLHAYLEQNIKENVSAQTFFALLAKIERWKFGREMEPVRARLNAMRTAGAETAVKEILAVLEEETNRVIRLIRHVADEFISAHQHEPRLQPVIGHLQAIMARDAADPARLTPEAEQLAIRCMLALAKELSRRLGQCELSLDDLWDVFSSGPGAGIVGQLMFAPFMSAN